MIAPALQPAFRRRLAWLLLGVALLSYLALTIAEQGSEPSGLTEPPPAPLPFARERVFGLDLQDRGSVDALRWLQVAGNPSPALLALPVDADIVAALGTPDQQPTAFGALDLLFSSAGSSPVALCLRRPAQTVGNLSVAQAAIGALNERYTQSIAYVSACEPRQHTDWQRAVAQAALKEDAAPSGLDNAYVPLAAGAAAVAGNLTGDSVETAAIKASDGAHYVLLSTSPRSSITPALAASAQQAMQDISQLGLVLVRPSADADPAAFVAALGSARLPAGVAPQGYIGVTSAGVALAGNWQPSVVGVVPYRRASSEGATASVEFVGADIYALTVLSPSSGDVNVWVDPPVDGPLPPPLTISLASDQARDRAVFLAGGLPAAHHRLVLSTAGGDVTLSGFFVSGRATPGWANGLATVALLIIAIGALADICYSSVVEVRARAGLPSRGRAGEHPRGFSLRR